MKNTLLIAILTAATVANAHAASSDAARVPVLLELFTSEGCSSCPPADTFLRKLDQLQPIPGARLIVLSEHVDYWNQLGWKDPFSSAELTQRQSNYAERLGSDVFTPQVVVDGREQFVGADAKSIQAAILRAANRAKAGITVREASRDGSSALVHILVPPLSFPAQLWVALADDHDESSVRHGENSGRTLTHVAVVRRLSKVASLSKAKDFDRTLNVALGSASQSGDLRVVAFLERNGMVEGADSVHLMTH